MNHALNVGGRKIGEAKALEGSCLVEIVYASERVVEWGVGIGCVEIVYVDLRVMSMLSESLSILMGVVQRRRGQGHNYMVCIELL